jgi:hypothetical protein
MSSRQIITAAALASGLALLAGCSGNNEQAADDVATSAAATQDSNAAAEQPLLSVTFDGNGCSYGGPSDVGAGVVGVDVDNTSEIGSGALLLRLVEGATVDDFAAAHQPEPYLGEPLDIAEPSGAVRRTLPGQTGSSTFPVESGTYVVLCLVDTDDPDDPASYLAQPAGVTVSE